jgi:hypothetical protein
MALRKAGCDARAVVGCVDGRARGVGEKDTHGGRAGRCLKLLAGTCFTAGPGIEHGRERRGELSLASAIYKGLSHTFPVRAYLYSLDAAQASRMSPGKQLLIARFDVRTLWDFPNHNSLQNHVDNSDQRPALLHKCSFKMKSANRSTVPAAGPAHPPSY